MRKGRWALALAAAALVPAAAGGPADAAPRQPVFVPGESLGGARLGMTKAEILAVWGRRHGVCRGCRRLTWYFNDEPFEPQGTGVSFERGRAVALFTVWQPEGWTTPEGLGLGEPEAEATLAYGALVRRRCAGYDALVRPGGGADTAFYLHDGEVWGFGLVRPGASPCV